MSLYNKKVSKRKCLHLESEASHAWVPREPLRFVNARDCLGRTQARVVARDARGSRGTQDFSGYPATAQPLLA